MLGLWLLSNIIVNADENKRSQCLALAKRPGWPNRSAGVWAVRLIPSQLLPYLIWKRSQGNMGKLEPGCKCWSVYSLVRGLSCTWRPFLSYWATWIITSNMDFPVYKQMLSLQHSYFDIILHLIYQDMGARRNFMVMKLIKASNHSNMLFARYIQSFFFLGLMACHVPKTKSNSSS